MSNSFMFSVIPVLVGLGFVLVFVLFVSTFVKVMKQWQKNNDSPVLTVEAFVSAKRQDDIHHNTTQQNIPGSPEFGSTTHTTVSTTYYATFQVESGDRIEFIVPDREYGQLAEGDRGRLTFQGTRYKGFERI